MRLGRWTAVVVAILIVAGTSGSTLAAGLFYAMLVPLLAALYVARRPPRLISALRSVSAGQVEAGESVSVVVEVLWERAFGPAWVMVSDVLPQGLEAGQPVGRLFVGPTTRRVRIPYSVVARRRGYYPIGPISVSCGDLFGIADTDADLADRDFLTVYPKIVALPEIVVPSNRPIGSAKSAQTLFEDSTRSVGIRDYRPGDPLSRIHWKATAKTGAMQSRVYEPSSSIEVDLLLNLFREDYPGGEAEVELACTAAASLAAHLSRNRRRVGIMSNGLDAARRYGQGSAHAGEAVWLDVAGMQADLPSVLSAIARLETTDATSLPDYLAAVQPRLRWRATLLFITHRLDDWSAQALERLKRAGFALAGVIVGDGDVAEHSLGIATAIGVPTSWARTEQELEVLKFWRPSMR